ncbi:MAG: PAS domain S-box protein, partial [Methylococcaceae bacterium]|nr:PAS domain S-box protein [Methylococcaceae bacterium]
MLISSISDPVSQTNSIDIFPWDDNFNTGLAKVDEQHRRLVQLLNVLASHVAFRSDIPQWNEIFDELSDYAVYHLQTEETIWHEFFVDDISEVKHRNSHASFIEEVERLKAGQASKPKSQVVEDALDFLVRWLASHILESDRYMAYTVLAMKEGMTLNEAKLHAQEQMGGATQTLVDIILSVYSTLSANTLRLMRELAEHRQAKIALIRESERNRALLLLASDGIHILDQDGNIVEASDSFCAMLGYPRDDIIGMNVADWDAGFSKAELSQFFKKICASPDRFEFETRHRCKDGNLIEVEVSAILVQVDKTPLVYASSRDITKRKQTELALHESQKRFYDIALASADWIWEVDAQSRYTYASDSVFSLLGYHPEELHDKTPFDFMPPDEANRVGETLGKIVATKSSFQNLENIVLGKNGSEHVILTNGTPILDTEGNLLGYRGVDRDITELKKTEVELNLTAQRLNEAQRMARIGNWELDLVANRLTWSDQVYSIFEIDKELFGPSYEAFLNVIHPGDREAVNSAYMQSLETRQAYAITHRLLFAD